MPRMTQHRKVETFNFRIDPALKAAFTQATEADDKPAAQVLRDFMRAYVVRQRRRSFATEARRQSLAIAERARDPQSDEARSLRELESLLDDAHDENDWQP